ncbi:MAG: carbon-nitrogen hydrolase family protein, partial [Burkholderiales bacterium]|nr:carbon-nitrogen hydrolase family protein [Burkholderiales bacterium]
MYKIAAVQMVSRSELAPNLNQVRTLVAQAAKQGAQLVLLPEYWGIMGKSDKDKVALREELGQGPMQDCMRSLAIEHGIWLIGGTVPLAASDDDKVWNTTLVYDPQGQL